jgi:hypothetical protein
MTPTCQELIEFLGDYVAGDLPSERIAGFEKHLALCTSCVAYLSSYRETIRITQTTFSVEIETLPPDLLTAILATVASRK